MPHVTVAGTGLHYRESGSGPLAVLIHGFPLDSTVWLDQLAGLGHRRRVIAIDLVGFGASDPVSDPILTMERHAADVAALVEALDEEQADVVGLSMGGYVALALWEHHHSVVRSLVLVDTRSGDDDDSGKAKRDVMKMKVLVQGRAQLARDLTDGLLGPNASQMAKARLRTMVEGTRYETIVAALEGMKARPDRTEMLSGVTVPGLVIVGEDDPVTPPSEAESMAAALPDSALRLIADAGHLTPIEQSAAVNAALLEFFARVDTGGNAE